MKRKETVETFYEVGYTLTPGRSVLISEGKRVGKRDLDWYVNDALTRGRAEKSELGRRGVRSTFVVWKRLVTVSTITTTHDAIVTVVHP